MSKQLGYNPKSKYLVADRSIAEVVKDILESPDDYGIPDNISMSAKHEAAILLASRMRDRPGQDVVDEIAEEISDRREIDRLKFDKHLTHDAACLTHALSKSRER